MKTWATARTEYIQPQSARARRAARRISIASARSAAVERPPVGLGELARAVVELGVADLAVLGLLGRLELVARSELRGRAARAVRAQRRDHERRRRSRGRRGRRAALLTRGRARAPRARRSRRGPARAGAAPARSRSARRASTISAPIQIQVTIGETRKRKVGRRRVVRVAVGQPGQRRGEERVAVCSASSARARRRPCRPPRSRGRRSASDGRHDGPEVLEQRRRAARPRSSPRPRRSARRAERRVLWSGSRSAWCAACSTPCRRARRAARRRSRCARGGRWAPRRRCTSA